MKKKGLQSDEKRVVKKGRIEGEAGLILIMHKNGLSAEQIASATDKTLKEVAEIIAGKTSTQI